MRAETVRRLALLGLVAAAVAAFFALDLGQYLTLDSLKARRADLDALDASHAWVFVAGYFAAYVAMAALSLPGGLVMSLAGGALFGFWLGLVVVSFASSIGAVLACLVARYVARDWAEQRFERAMRRVDDGIEREGAFYLFTLRLIPLVPFFVLNMAVGLTRMRLWTIYWVSQLGMLLPTMVFVNAGKELGGLQSASGLLSPSLLTSFALIGVFPLAVRRGLGWYRRRKGLGEP